MAPARTHRTDGETSPSKTKQFPAGSAIGVDIGGTKIAVGVCDSDGRVLVEFKKPTPARDPGDAMWDTINRLLDDVIAAGGRSATESITGIGVGCAGPMVWPEGVVSPTNITSWREFPLRRRLRERFPDMPVRVHNDAICMALAEHWKGAAQGHANALGMVVSTGVGGGLISGNRILDGGSGNAGHIGHTIVRADGPSCRCGGRGCLEAIARGPATVAWAVEHGWSPPVGQAVDGRSLADSARAGDLTAIDAFRRSGEAVGIALASVATLLDLDIAVIGGGLVQSGDLLMNPVRQAFDRHVGMTFAKRMKIVPAALDQDAGIVGAAALVLQGHRYWSPAD